MSNADVHGFLLAGVVLGVVISTLVSATLIYTLGVREWGPPDLGLKRASWPIQLAGFAWLMLILGGAMFASWWCGNEFHIQGTSQAAQKARMWFGLIWAGMGSVSIFASLVVIARKKHWPFWPPDAQPKEVGLLVALRRVAAQAMPSSPSVPPASNPGKAGEQASPVPSDKPKR